MGREQLAIGAGTALLVAGTGYASGAATWSAWEKMGLTHGALLQCGLARFEWIRNSQTGSNGFEFKSKPVQNLFDPKRTFLSLENLK
jgi:hypothetical protein